MKLRNILGVALKFVGIIYFINAIVYVSTLISTVSYFSAGTAENPLFDAKFLFIATVVYFVLNLTAGILLLLFGNAIAGKVVKSDEEVNIGDKYWDAKIFSLVLKTFGVICLVKGVPLFIQGLFQLHGQKLPFFQHVNLISMGIYVVVGLYFLFGGKLIVRIAIPSGKYKWWELKEEEENK